MLDLNFDATAFSNWKWIKGHKPPINLPCPLRSRVHFSRTSAPLAQRPKSTGVISCKFVFSKIRQQNQIFMKQTIKLYRRYYKDASFEFWCCFCFNILGKNVFPKVILKCQKTGITPPNFRIRSKWQALPLNEYWQVSW